METARQLTITLPADKAEALERAVQHGLYEDESEALHAGLDAALSLDHDFEEWLRCRVAPVYDRLMDDPSQALSADEVQAHLDHRRRSRRPDAA